MNVDVSPPAIPRDPSGEAKMNGMFEYVPEYPL